MEASLARLKEIQEFARSAETFAHHRDRANIEAELREIEARGLQVITLADANYPKPLRAIDAAPPVLYLKWEYVEKDELGIAIVGTRRPSSYGIMIAEKLAKELGELGFTIVSGLALGIDTSAHRGALATKARTIAVLGGGFSNIYPQENRNLVEEIARSGAVMSEYSLKTPPDRWTFPRRNRIISGLTRGTIVVEAPQRSGALITAKFALEQGRYVFAVPGPITEEASKGTHQLIQQGAKLVTDIDDILAEFADLQETLSSHRAILQKPRPSLSPVEEQVFQVLQYEPLHFNEIVERTQLSPTETSYALLQLVMKDIVKELAGQRYAKLP